jgi:dTMP kinase
VHTTTGVFVCFEGGEGAGKSTQARSLAATLADRGYRTLLTFEPGDTAVGKEMRRIVLDPAPRRCCTPPTRPSTSTRS